MRSLSTAFLVSSLAVPLAAGGAAAQGMGLPSRLAEVEGERSRSCVTIVQRLEAVDERMAPFARRVERLRAIAEAIALEERSFVDSLRADDPLEARVREWFATDEALARRYVTQQDPTLLAERNAGRETIKAAVTQAMQEVQTRADEALGDDEDVLGQAARCDGAIFLRPAVVEACGTGSGALCEDARLPAAEATRFRFVDVAETLWDMQEMRPWSQPTPLRAGPNGLAGGRTVGYTRVGNVVATVAFTPILLPREQIPPETLQAYQATNDSLGLSSRHPTIAFTPAIGVRVTLPQPLDEEDGYILHFGSPDQAEVVWAGDAGTGGALEATVPLTAGQVRRLAAGDRLTLTAVAEAEPQPEAVYAIGLGNVAQAQSAQALLGYMRNQLGQDLSRLVPSSGSE